AVGGGGVFGAVFGGTGGVGLAVGAFGQLVAALGVGGGADGVGVGCTGIGQGGGDHVLGHVVACRGAALDGVNQVVEYVHVVGIVGGEQAGGAAARPGGPRPGLLQRFGVEQVPAALVEIVAVHLLQQGPGEPGGVAGAAHVDGGGDQSGATGVAGGLGIGVGTPRAFPFGQQLRAVGQVFGDPVLLGMLQGVSDPLVLDVVPGTFTLSRREQAVQEDAVGAPQQGLDSAVGVCDRGALGWVEPLVFFVGAQGGHHDTMLTAAGGQQAGDGPSGQLGGGEPGVDVVEPQHAPGLLLGSAQSGGDPRSGGGDDEGVTGQDRSDCFEG